MIRKEVKEDIVSGSIQLIKNKKAVQTEQPFLLKDYCLFEFV